MPYYIWLLFLLLVGGGGTWAIVGHHNEANNDNLPTPQAIERPLEPGITRPVAPIPEPGSALLFAVGGIVVGLAVRRRLD